jgi:nucleoside-diphosphate-sugar epimerase
MGFLGRHLVRRLLEDGHTVIGVDKDMDEREIQALEKDYPGRHIFAQGDLLTAFGYRVERDNSYPPPPGEFRCSDGTARTIFKILEDFKPGWMFHMAAMAQEPASRQFPAFSRVLNHDMPLDLMAAAYEYWEKLEGQARDGK